MAPDWVWAPRRERDALSASHRFVVFYVSFLVMALSCMGEILGRADLLLPLCFVCWPIGLVIFPAVDSTCAVNPLKRL